MEWLVQNWASIVFVLLAATAVYSFLTLSTTAQKDKAKEWLKYAVSLAEQKYGGKTGELKLHMVYDMFITKFPQISYFISFDTFKLWVDEALDWLDEQLSTNKAIVGAIYEDIT